MARGGERVSKERISEVSRSGGIGVSWRERRKRALIVGARESQSGRVAIIIGEPGTNQLLDEMTQHVLHHGDRLVQRVRVVAKGKHHVAH